MLWDFLSVQVMVLTNLQGTIVSNLVCGLIGGPGLTAGSNYGPKYALFEPGTRNTGTKLANQNVANPIAMLNASVELLKHIEMNQHAEVRSQLILNTVQLCSCFLNLMVSQIMMRTFECNK